MGAAWLLERISVVNIKNGNVLSTERDVQEMRKEERKNEEREESVKSHRRVLAHFYTAGPRAICLEYY